MVKSESRFRIWFCRKVNIYNFETMKSALYKKIMYAAVLLNSVVLFAQADEPPTPPPPTPPPGLPVDAGVLLLLVGALGLGFYYFKNMNTKKASK